MTPAIITLIILAVAVFFFVTEKLPMGITAFLTTLALYFFGIINAKVAFAQLANSNIVLICAMCVVGAAYFKTGMAYKTGNLITRIAKTERTLLVGVMLVGGVMSGFLSNTGTVAVLMPIVLGICARTGIKPIKLLLPLAMAATIGADLSLIGSPGNLIANATIQEYSKGVMSFGFFEYSKLGIPLLLGTILFMAFFSNNLIPDRESGEHAQANLDYSAIPAWKGQFTLGVLVVTIVAMVFEKTIGVPLYISACMGASALVVAGVLTEKEAYASFEMVVVFLLAFMLPMASALSSSGASTIITDKVLAMTGDKGPYVLMGALWILTCVLTQFMSNTATCAVLCPIGVTIAGQIGADPRAVVLAIFIASSIAVATPLAIPGNAMVMGPAGAKFKDFAYAGVPVIILCFIISMVLLPILYPFFP